MRQFMLLMPVLLAVGCSGADAGSTGSTGSSGSTGTSGAAPKVTSTLPAGDAVNVWNGADVVATFDTALNPASVTPTSVQLVLGSTLVEGQVVYEPVSRQVRFHPAAVLRASQTYSARLTTALTSASGVALAQARQWSFTTRASSSAQPVSLGASANYVVLAKTQISTVPTSAVTGDVGLSPAAATFITGFSLTDDATTTFATSPQVTGRVYAADHGAPTGANLTAAVVDMGTAFTDAAGRAPDVTELGAGDVGGLTLPPGVYKWASGLLIPSDLVLAGSATDVWVLSVAQNLDVRPAVRVTLSGGASPKNIFWQVSGAVRLGTAAHLEGVVLSQTAITLETGASVHGRLLAQSAVNLDSNVVTAPGL
jgi:hypothetical protein